MTTMPPEGDDDHGTGGATLIHRQRSSSTVQSFCLIFNHRLVGPPSYTLASSLAT
jgi:hypothetical protein